MISYVGEWRLSTETQAYPTWTLSLASLTTRSMNVQFLYEPILHSLPFPRYCAYLSARCEMMMQMCYPCACASGEAGAKQAQDPELKGPSLLRKRSSSRRRQCSLDSWLAKLVHC